MIIGVDFVDLDFFYFFYCVCKNAKLKFFIVYIKMRDS